jgi:hypothetical protein
VSQGYPDGPRDELTVGAQLIEEIGIIRKGIQDIGDEVTGGLLPGDETERKLGARLDIAETMTLNFGADQTA